MKTTINTLSMLALAVSFSYAQEDAKPERRPPPSPERIFQKIDADQSGSVSIDEFKAGPRAQKNPEKAEEIFKKIDADSSGDISLDEFKSHRPKHPGGMHRKGKRLGNTQDDEVQAPPAE